MLLASKEFSAIRRLKFQFIRGVSTRYTYNKTIPQVHYSKESIVLSFTKGKNPVDKRAANQCKSNKYGLRSGKALPPGEFFYQHILFDDDANSIESSLLPFSGRFVDLIRDDMWILDPMSLTEDQVPESLHITPCPKSVVDIVAPYSKLMRFNESLLHGVGNICSIGANILTDPGYAKETYHRSMNSLKTGASHVWTSTKLYGHELRAGSKLFKKLIFGGQLSYREKKELLHAVSDTSRLVPFTVFAVIPFSEFALPFVLKKFPNFLPSTFTSEAKKADIKKNLLEARLKMAREYYDKMKEHAKKIRRQDLQSEDCADDLVNEIKEVVYGQQHDMEDVVHVCQLFRDETVVDYMDKPQLTSIAKYMNVMTIGGDEMTRVGLRTRIRTILKEDRQLYFEGMNQLTRSELAQCCEERGMTSDGLLKADYLSLMNEWLEYSVNKRIPISILLMSNMLSMLSKETSIESMLSNAVGMLSDDIIKETVLEVAPVNDKTAMRMRYERAIRAEEEVREENRMKQEFVLNNMQYFNPVENKPSEKKTKRIGKGKKKESSITFK